MFQISQIVHEHCGDHSHSTHPDSRQKPVLLSLLCCSLLLGAISGCSRVPQVLTDEAAFSELDALYTAVTSKRRDLLNDCRQRITKLHDEKRMADAGFDVVKDIIETAEEGQWDPAAQRLYDFMRGQRKQK